MPQSSSDRQHKLLSLAESLANNQEFCDTASSFSIDRTARLDSATLQHAAHVGYPLPHTVPSQSFQAQLGQYNIDTLPAEVQRLLQSYKVHQQESKRRRQARQRVANRVGFKQGWHRDGSTSGLAFKSDADRTVRD